MNNPYINRSSTCSIKILTYDIFVPVFKLKIDWPDKTYEWGMNKILNYVLYVWQILKHKLGYTTPKVIFHSNYSIHQILLWHYYVINISIPVTKHHKTIWYAFKQSFEQIDMRSRYQFYCCKWYWGEHNIDKVTF